MSELESLLAAHQAAEAVPPGIAALVARLRRDYEGVAVAILFYGSCRRRASGEGLADLLVLVDDYRKLHRNPLAGLLHRALPPNVHYLEVAAEDGVQRCKYALVSLAGFARRCRYGLDAYFRARFAQPCQLLWVADASTMRQVVAARASALRTFCGEFAPLLQGPVGAQAFWVQALSASYRCELRPEPPGAAAQLVAADLAYYRATAAAVLAELPGVIARGEDDWLLQPSRRQRLRARLRWTLRRPWSKTLNVLRLLKAAGTFSNGIDYLLWKIERHSGVRIEATPRMRRFPRLSALGLAWTVWRRKVLQ